MRTRIIHSITTAILLLAAIATASADLTDLPRYAPGKEFTVEPYGLACYDTGLRTPRWVLHQIDEQSLQGSGDRKGVAFFADPGIDARWRVHPNWFAGSGFDRGHCAPAADFHHTQELMDSCMSMRNIMVQARMLNEHEWASMEAGIRKLTTDGHTVTCVTGPCWKSTAVSTTKVVRGMVAGTHCFKAVLIEKRDVKECLAWLAPNNDTPGEWDSWRLSTDALEEVIGLDLWPNLSEKEAAILERRR